MRERIATGRERRETNAFEHKTGNCQMVRRVVSKRITRWGDECENDMHLERIEIEREASQ